MTEPPHITKAPGNVSRSLDGDHASALVAGFRLWASRGMREALVDFSQIAQEEYDRANNDATAAVDAMVGRITADLPCVITRPPRQPSDTTRTALGLDVAKPRRQPRRPPLDSLLKQAAKAGKSVKGAEVYQDRTVLQFGEPEPVEPDNPWPLDEFRTKETKQ